MTTYVKPPQPVVQESQPLPAGAATATLQETGNAILASLTTPEDTQPVSAASLPLPSGAATSASQATGNASLASIDTKTPALVAGRQPVDGSGVTQPISAAALPLPTGASTAAAQTTANTTLASILAAQPLTADAELNIARGLIAGVSIVNKFGYNPDIDTGTIPEDVWELGGVYTGFATAAETLQVFSASALDAAAGTGARSIRIVGLDASYNPIAETVTLAGTTPVLTTQQFLRAHTATIITAGTGGVNAGIVTVRQSTTVANVMLSMTAGRNQTNCSAYTVPAGFTAYMRDLHAAAGITAATIIEGNIWTRSFGGVFRSRRPFFISNNYTLDDYIYGGLVFTEKSDLVIRVVNTSANNGAVNAGYDLILVANG